MRWRSGTLDDLYFEWLYDQVGDVYESDPRKTHWNLCRKFYCIEFLYFVPNDDNRAQDGLEMRERFLKETGEYIDPYWESLPCSIFEMLVALARRMEFETGRPVDHWFWIFMESMRLTNLTDSLHSWNVDPAVEHAAHVLNHRLYLRDGRGGGLFVVKDPHANMPKTEIWYQMSAYLREEAEWTSTVSL